VASLPLAQRLGRLGSAALPAATLLDRLTGSLDRTGAIEQLMGLLFNGAVAGNGFDSLGHFVRAEPLISSCTAYVHSPLPGCTAKFTGAGSASAAEASAVGADGSAADDRVVSQAVREAGSRSTPRAEMQGLMTYLTGSRK
jgi:hypothetical protein